MVAHADVTRNNIHEPKGVESATSGEVYIADGGTSGGWKTVYTQGFEDYNDSGSSQSLTSGVYVDLTNDGGGALTNSAYRLPTKSAIWDTVLNEFDFSGAGLAVGDTLDIRFDLDVTTSAANREITLGLDIAHGDPSEYHFDVDITTYKNAGTYRTIKWLGIYIGNTATLNNPAKVSLKSDGAGDSVVVNGFYIRTLPRTPIFN